MKISSYVPILSRIDWQADGCEVLIEVVVYSQVIYEACISC